MTAQKGLIDENGRECLQCGIYKTWDNFHKRTNRKISYVSKCKKCTCKNPDFYNPKIKLIIDKNGRQCKICKKYKTWDNFYKHKTGINGYHSRCSTCHNKSNRPLFEIVDKATLQKARTGYKLSIPKNMWPSIANNVRFKIDKKLMLLELVPVMKSMVDTHKVRLDKNRYYISLANQAFHEVLPELDIFLRDSRVFISIPDEIILDIFNKKISGIQKNFSDLTITKWNFSIRTEKWPISLSYFSVNWIPRTKTIIIIPELKQKYKEKFKYSPKNIRNIRYVQTKKLLEQYPDIVTGDYIYTGKNKDGSLKFRALNRAPMFDEFGNEL